MLFVAASLIIVMFHVFQRPTLNPPRGLNGGPSPRLRVAQFRHYAHESYGDFLWQRVGHGSLGHSRVTGADLTQPMVEIGLITLSLVAGGLVLGLLVGVPLGLAWERWPRRAARPGAIFAYLGLSLAPVVLGRTSITSWPSGGRSRRTATPTSSTRRRGNPAGRFRGRIT
jgi:ABC-type dipeptide/oligopeptide/nickel transport system permease component